MSFVSRQPANPNQRPAANRCIALLAIIALSSDCAAAFAQQPNVEAVLTPGSPAAPTHVIAGQPTPLSPVIVIGFLGGHVKKGNAIHREVQVAMHLRKDHPAGVYVEVFQNAHGQDAFREIQRQLDVDHDGTLSAAEKKHARIIIYGHSWGATETVMMARQLEDSGIPVLLTVLVDRVPKIGEGDERIPANVAQAVNFYQSNGLLHGRNAIRAMDPASTKILGNYQFDYKTNHVACNEYPWYARAFMGPHIEIENDPRVWNQVESLITAKIASKLSPEKNPTVATLAAH